MAMSASMRQLLEKSGCVFETMLGYEVVVVGPARGSSSGVSVTPTRSETVPPVPKAPKKSTTRALMLHTVPSIAKQPGAFRKNLGSVFAAVSDGTPKRSKSCALCKGVGHTKRTCVVDFEEGLEDIESIESVSSPIAKKRKADDVVAQPDLEATQAHGVLAMTAEADETEDDDKADAAVKPKKPRVSAAPTFSYWSLGAGIELPPGAYYLGDPETVMAKGSEARVAYESNGCEDGLYVLSDDQCFGVVQTSRGPGVYKGTNGVSYKVGRYGALCLMSTSLVVDVWDTAQSQCGSFHTLDGGVVRMAWSRGSLRLRGQVRRWGLLHSGPSGASGPLGKFQEWSVTVEC